MIALFSPYLSINASVYLFPFLILCSSTLQTNIFGLTERRPVCFKIFFSNLPIIINAKQIIQISMISLSLSFLATIYPSIKSTKVEPINLIKWD